MPDHDNKNDALTEENAEATVSGINSKEIYDETKEVNSDPKKFALLAPFERDGLEFLKLIFTDPKGKDAVTALTKHPVLIDVIRNIANEEINEKIQEESAKMRTLHTERGKPITKNHKWYLKTTLSNQTDTNRALKATFSSFRNNLTHGVLGGLTVAAIAEAIKKSQFPDEDPMNNDNTKSVVVTSLLSGFLFFAVLSRLIYSCYEKNEIKEKANALKQDIGEGIEDKDNENKYVVTDRIVDFTRNAKRTELLKKYCPNLTQLELTAMFALISGLVAIAIAYKRHEPVFFTAALAYSSFFSQAFSRIFTKDVTRQAEEEADMLCRPSGKELDSVDNTFVDQVRRKISVATTHRPKDGGTLVGGNASNLHTRHALKSTQIREGGGSLELA